MNDLITSDALRHALNNLAEIIQDAALDSDMNTLDDALKALRQLANGDSIDSIDWDSLNS